MCREPSGTWPSNGASKNVGKKPEACGATGQRGHPRDTHPAAVLNTGPRLFPGSPWGAARLFIPIFPKATLRFQAEGIGGRGLPGAGGTLGPSLACPTQRPRAQLRTCACCRDTCWGQKEGHWGFASERGPGSSCDVRKGGSAPLEVTHPSGKRKSKPVKHRFPCTGTAFIKKLTNKSKRGERGAQLEAVSVGPSWSPRTSLTGM